MNIWNKKNIIYILLCILSTIIITWCNISKEEEKIVDNKKLQITTSIVPIASIVEVIGGENVSVTSLIPAWISPHGFDVSPKDLIALEQSDKVFVLYQNSSDSFLDQYKSNSNTIALGKKIEKLSAQWHDHNHEDDKEEINNEELSTDPHIWTWPKNGIILAQEILLALQNSDPKNSGIFQKNYDTFSEKLETINNNFIEKNKQKIQKEFIVFHDAYNYILQDLEIQQDKKVVFQENVLSRSNIAEYKEFIDEIELHGIDVFFKEPQFELSAIKDIISKNNIWVFTLDPLGSSQDNNGYIQTLEKNINALQNIYE